MIGQNFKCSEKFRGYQGYVENGFEPPVLQFEEGSSITLHDYGFNLTYTKPKTEICLAAFEGKNAEILTGY